MTTVVLVRHGSTEWNESKRAQGQADIHLSERGRREAERTARRLADVPVAAVYSSDLVRAVETARPIAASHGLEVVTDPGWREIDQGEWTGLTTAEIKRRWPDLWGPARHYSTRPSGESPDQVRHRALDALRRVVAAHPDETVVVVSHGGTIRWVSAEAMSYDARASAGLRGLSNGGGVSIDARIEDGKLRLGGLRRLDGASPDLDDPND